MLPGAFMQCHHNIWVFAYSESSSCSCGPPRGRALTQYVSWSFGQFKMESQCASCKYESLTGGWINTGVNGWTLSSMGFVSALFGGNCVYLWQSQVIALNTRGCVPLGHIQGETWWYSGYFTGWHVSSRTGHYMCMRVARAATRFKIQNFIAIQLSC